MAGQHRRNRTVDAMVPVTPLAPSEARAVIAAIGSELPRQLVADAVLLVSELVTNCVRHAGGGPDGRVLVRVSATARGVRVEVHDWGPGFELNGSPIPRHDEGSGFGLYLVQRLATRWGTEQGRTTRVWFEIDAARTG
jgi:anti-sigma regulatory factor (Ser/Thr protein kinase)